MSARVLLSPREELLWRQNRDLLVAAANPNNRCRCGERKELHRVPSKHGTDWLIGSRIVSRCVKRRWWNFWRHDPPIIVVHY